jgi:hypothetical protein
MYRASAFSRALIPGNVCSKPEKKHPTLSFIYDWNQLAIHIPGMLLFAYASGIPLSDLPS